MTDSSPISGWLQRLDAVEERLQREVDKSGGTTSPDPGTGEAWERGQLWGHIAEFVPFWSGQIVDLIDEYVGQPIAYGRSKDGAERKAGIDAGMEIAISTLWAEVRSDLSDLRHILTALPAGWQRAVGLHPAQGEQPAEAIIERTLISHLEEHATQLEAIS